MQGLEPGDHIVAPDDVYWGLRKVIGDVFGKAGLETSYVDMTQLDDVRAAMRPNTRLVWIETPSNPLMKVTDLAAIAEIVRAAGPNAITVCDGTFATPVLQRPLDCGIDMVAHSTTKYIGGHSDVVGGALITRHDNYLFERARRAQHYGGAVPSPFDCWLTMRGIDTLPYRRAGAFGKRRCGSRAACASTRASRRCTIRACRSIRARDRGAADVGVRRNAVVPGARRTRRRRWRSRRVAGCSSARPASAGAHSLIEHRASVEGPRTRTPQNLLRFSVGLEHPDDLIEDLQQALG